MIDCGFVFIAGVLYAKQLHIGDVICCMLMLIVHKVF